MDSLWEALGRPLLGAPAPGPWAGGPPALLLSNAMSAGCVSAFVLLLGCGGRWLGIPRGPEPIGGTIVSLGVLTRWWVPCRFGMLRTEFVLLLGMCAGSCPPPIRNEQQPSTLNWGAPFGEGTPFYCKIRTGH